MKVPAGLHIDDPSWPLLDGLVSYWGITTANGNADGCDLVCAGLANDLGLNYTGHKIKILSGQSAGQSRWIAFHPQGAPLGWVPGTVVVDQPWGDPNMMGGITQIVTGTLFVILSVRDDRFIYAGAATANGADDGTTLIDNSALLNVYLGGEDSGIGCTIRLLGNTVPATWAGPERQIYDHDYIPIGNHTFYFDIPFLAQVVTGTRYIILRNRPVSGGGPGPMPEPETEETAWKLSDYDPFDVADATADTLRWSSEYISAGAADGAADINITGASRLYVNVLRAAVAAAEYGVRRLQAITGRHWFSKVDADVNVTNPGPLLGWGGMSVSAGVAWDANNWIRIYKREDNAPADEGISVQWRLGGGGVNLVTFNTTQELLAFRIERNGNIWRCYYSLTPAPRHHWVLLQEIEDAANNMTDTVSLYLSVYNPEDAVGESVTAMFDKWELYDTLGNIADIIAAITAIDLAALNTRLDRQLFTLDYWSVPQITVTVPAGAANRALPNVVMALLPAGATVVKATGMFKFRIVENSNQAANALAGDQHIQIQRAGNPGYANCISLVDDLFTLGAGPLRESGDVIIGDHNVAAQVTVDDTYNFQWTAAVADVASLIFYDVQTGIRIWYSI